jgi:hypothetical protein
MIAHIEQKFKWTQRKKFPLSSEDCEVRAPLKSSNPFPILVQQHRSMPDTLMRHDNSSCYFTKFLEKNERQPLWLSFVLFDSRIGQFKPGYMLNRFKVFILSSVKKTSRLPLASLVAAARNKAEPLPDWGSTGTLSSRCTPTTYPCDRFSSTRLLSFMLTTRRSPFCGLIVRPPGIFKGLPWNTVVPLAVEHMVVVLRVLLFG